MTFAPLQHKFWINFNICWKALLLDVLIDAGAQIMVIPEDPNKFKQGKPEHGDPVKF